MIVMTKIKDFQLGDTFLKEVYMYSKIQENQSNPILQAHKYHLSAKIYKFIKIVVLRVALFRMIFLELVCCHIMYKNLFAVSTLIKTLKVRH